MDESALVYVTSVFFASVIMSLRHFPKSASISKNCLALTAGLAVKAGTNYLFVAICLERSALALRQLLGLCVMMVVMMSLQKRL